MSLLAEQTWTPMTAQERARFDRDGFLVIPAVLTENEVAVARNALSRSTEIAARAGGLGANGALHQLSAVTNNPELAFLLDHPKAFKYIWSILGWNVHVYHSHIDVHPQIHERQPDWWHWHQDGGRQNRELETDPRPRMSVKLAYWLSDVSETGRGNFTVLPGSHLTNWLPGPPARGVPWPQPEGCAADHRQPGRRGRLRPAAVARTLGQLFADHAHGCLLRVHVPLGRSPRRGGGPAADAGMGDRTRRCSSSYSVAPATAAATTRGVTTPGPHRSTASSSARGLLDSSIPALIP